MNEKITLSELANVIVEVASITGKSYECVYDEYIKSIYTEQHSLKNVLKHINKKIEQGGTQ